MANLGSLFALSHCHFPKPSEACKDVTRQCHSFKILACWMRCITVKEQISIRATIMSKLASKNLFWCRWVVARPEQDAPKIMLGKRKAGISSRYQSMNAQGDAEQSPLSQLHRGNILQLPKIFCTMWCMQSCACFIMHAMPLSDMC